MKFIPFSITLLVALAVCATGLMPTASSTTNSDITVNTSADEINVDGDCSLREAIQAANTDTAVDACPAGNGADTIHLPAGVFLLTITGPEEALGLTGDLDVYAPLTLLGAGARSTIIDGNQLDRVIEIDGATNLTITGITLQNGNLPGTGPAYSGGGIAVLSNSTLVMNDSTVENNQAGDSGGGLFNNGGTVTLNNTRVANNQAVFAAGIRNTGSLTIIDSSIVGNQATNYAGGIMSSQTLSLDRSTISGNTAGTNGGGLYVYLGTASLTNSTVSGNTIAGSMGGGVWVYYQATAEITASTIAANRGGAGLFNYHEGAGGDLQNPNILLKQTILAGNTPVNCGRTINAPYLGSLGYNLDSGHACGLTFTGDLADTNPLLGPLQENGGPTTTHALTTGSPAIDHIAATACSATDQRGILRPQGSGGDIGAFEAIQNANADLGLALFDTPDPVQTSSPFTYTLNVNNAGPDPAQLVTVLVQLPAGATYQGFAGSGWDCLGYTDAINCKRPDLAAGAAPVLLIHLLAPATGGTLDTTSSVSSAISDPQALDNTASAQTTVVAPTQDRADLALLKSAHPNPVQAGGALTYLMQLSNTGPDAAGTITLSDDLPPEVTYQGFIGSGWGCNFAAGTVTCTLASLAVGAAPELSILVTAPTTTGTLANTACVSATIPDPDSNNNCAITQTSVTAAPAVWLHLPAILGNH